MEQFFGRYDTYCASKGQDILSNTCVCITFMCEFFKFCISTSNKSLYLPYLLYVLWDRHRNLNLIIQVAPIDDLKTSYSVNVLKIHMNAVIWFFYSTIIACKTCNVIENESSSWVLLSKFKEIFRTVSQFSIYSSKSRFIDKFRKFPQQRSYLNPLFCKVASCSSIVKKTLQKGILVQPQLANNFIKHKADLSKANFKTQ